MAATHPPLRLIQAWQEIAGALDDWQRQADDAIAGSSRALDEARRSHEDTQRTLLEATASVESLEAPASDATRDAQRVWDLARVPCTGGPYAQPDRAPRPCPRSLRLAEAAVEAADRATRHGDRELRHRASARAAADRAGLGADRAASQVAEARGSLDNACRALRIASGHLDRVMSATGTSARVAVGGAAICRAAKVAVAGKTGALSSFDGVAGCRAEYLRGPDADVACAWRRSG